MDTNNEQVCDNSNMLARRTVSRGLPWYAQLTGNNFCLFHKRYLKKAVTDCLGVIPFIPHN
jgi:hypothetical protein